MLDACTALPVDLEQREFLRLENQLCFQIYTASRVMTQAYRPFLKALELTYPQYLLMMVLWQKQGELDDKKTTTPVLATSTVTEIGCKLRLDSGTLSPLLKRLEKQGLIKRQRNEKDERQLEVLLTPKGLQLSTQAAEVPMNLLCKFNLEGEQLWALKQQLEQLIAAIDEWDYSRH